MNGYILLKNVTLNGVAYEAGAIVPEEAVLPSRVPALLRTGVIARAGNLPEPQAKAGAKKTGKTAKKGDK